MTTRRNSQTDTLISQGREWDEEACKTIFAQFENFLSKNSMAYIKQYRAISTKENRIAGLEKHITEVEIDPFRTRVPKPPQIQWPSSVPPDERSQADSAIKEQFKQFVLAKLNIELEILLSDLARHKQDLNMLQDCEHTIALFVTDIKSLLLSLELSLSPSTSIKAKLRTMFIISMNKATNSVQIRTNTAQQPPVGAKSPEPINKEVQHSELLIATIKELSDQLKSLRMRPNDSARGRELTPNRRRGHGRERSSSNHSKRSSYSTASSLPPHRRQSPRHQQRRTDRGERIQEEESDRHSSWRSRNHAHKQRKPNLSPRGQYHGYKR